MRSVVEGTRESYLKALATGSLDSARDDRIEKFEIP